MLRKSAHCHAGWLIIMILPLIACDTNDPAAEEMDMTPEGLSVIVTNDLTYARAAAHASSDRALDVYAPEGSGDWPVAVLLHGANGSRKQFQYAEVSRRLAAQGVVVFNITYSTPQTFSSREWREGLELAVCATRFARQHAAEYRGDPARLTLIGQSAGGLFGSLASFLGEEIHSTWEAFEARRGGPPDQVTCVADATDASVQGFVGFNGAHFFPVALGIPEQDPEVWDILNLENHIGKNPSLTVRFIYGENDGTQPPWHVERINELAARLSNAGYDAEVPIVQAAHNFNFESPGWDRTLDVMLDVLRR